MSTPVTTRFTTVGASSWNWPAGETTAQVEVWGGGAGGGNGTSTRGGAGGGGGGYARAIVTKGSESALYVLVGDGSNPGSGAVGSTVRRTDSGGAVVCSATGAGPVVSTAGGTGGAGSIGDTLSTGGNGSSQGAAPFYPPTESGGPGGPSAGQNTNGADQPPSAVGPQSSGAPPGGGPGGDGGNGAPFSAGPNTDGLPGEAPGGGGGGGGKNKAGGRGARGEVRITCPPPKSGGRCCCACTLEQLNFPDSLIVDVEVDDVDPMFGFGGYSGFDCREICEDDGEGGETCYDVADVPWCPYGGESQGDAANGCCPAEVPVYGSPGCDDTCTQSPDPPNCEPSGLALCPVVATKKMLYDPAVLAGLRAIFGTPLEWVRDPAADGIALPPAADPNCCNLVFATPESTTVNIGCTYSDAPDTHHDAVYKHSRLVAGVPGSWVGNQPLLMSNPCCYQGFSWNVSCPSGLASALLFVQVCPNGSYSLRYVASYRPIMHHDYASSSWLGSCASPTGTTSGYSICDSVLSGVTLTLAKSGTIGALPWTFDELQAIVMDSTGYEGTAGGFYDPCSRAPASMVISAYLFGDMDFRGPFGGVGDYIILGCRDCHGSPIGYISGGVNMVMHYAALGHATGQIR